MLAIINFLLKKFPKRRQVSKKEKKERKKGINIIKIQRYDGLGIKESDSRGREKKSLK